MRGCLVLISPLDPATGTRIPVRCGDALNSRTLKADGFQWLSAITKRPRMAFDFFDTDYRGTVQYGTAGVTLNSRRLSGFTREYLTTLIWVGAPIQIWSGDAAATADMAIEFTGVVSSGVIDRSTGLLPLQCSVNRKLLDVPLLNIEYGGGGGSDGDTEVRGQLKPAAFGKPMNVEVKFFDQTNWIGQVDGYGNVTAINTLYEDAASFGAKLANYASYAALLAAVLAEGQWATCVAEGLVRLGADPQGVITTDPICGGGTPGTMMLRWLQNHAGISAGNINSQSLTDLDTALTTLLGHAPAVSFWTNSQVQVINRCEALLAAVNATMFIGPDGKITVSRAINAGAASITLNRIGGKPLVTDWRSLDAPDPWWRLKAEAAKTWRVHSLNEIDYEDDLVDMGNYSAAETYRQGMIVRQATNGIRYLYINATPGAGHTPPNATYWSLYEAAVDATTVKYSNGVPVDALRPAAANADVTGANTALAIVSQGTLATANQVNLGATGSVYREDALTRLTDLLAVTGLGTAQAIAGQGLFATINALLPSHIPGGLEGANVIHDPEFTDPNYWTKAGTNAALISFVTSTDATVAAMNATNAVKFDSTGAAVSSGSRVQVTTAVVPAHTNAAWVGIGRVRVKAGFNGKVEFGCFVVDRSGTILQTLGTFQPATDFTTVAAAADTTFDIDSGVLRITSATADHVQPFVNVTFGTNAPAGSAYITRFEFRRIQRLGLMLAREDGFTEVTDLLAITGLGTASAIASQGALATLNSVDLATSQVTNRILDNISDGSTYARTVATALTSGVPKVTVVGSGTTVGDPRNLPPIAGSNLGWKFTGTITYSASSGTPATATTTSSAGSLLLGTTSISYNSMTVNTTGTGGTSVTYYLYVSANAYTGGAHTLLATTSTTTPYSADANGYIGSVTIVYPSSGSGSGGGTGGGGSCVAADAWVEVQNIDRCPIHYAVFDQRFFVRARYIVPGDKVRALNLKGTGVEWAEVQTNALAIDERVRMTGKHSKLQLSFSDTTPIVLQGGSEMLPAFYDGELLPTFIDDLAWEGFDCEEVGLGEVAQISVGGRSFAAGDMPGRMLITHNQSKP